MQARRWIIPWLLLSTALLGQGRWGTTTITSFSPLPSAQAGSSYLYSFTASGGKPGYTWSASGIPSGLSLSTSGALSGVPTSYGTASLLVTVRDSRGQATSGTFALTIAPPLLVFPNQTPPQGQAGAPYNYLMVVQGGVPPYSWTLASGSLPPGLTLYPNGTVSGTPSLPGTYTAVLTVYDQTYTALTIVARAAIAPPARR